MEIVVIVDILSWFYDSKDKEARFERNVVRGYWKQPKKQ